MSIIEMLQVMESDSLLQKIGCGFPQAGGGLPAGNVGEQKDNIFREHDVEHNEEEDSASLRVI